MKKGELVNESYEFAEKVIDLCQRLITVHRDFVISNQLMRSGTSIGANIREAKAGISKADFVAKLFISLKESEETDYWLKLLRGRNYYIEEIDELLRINNRLRAMLWSSVKTARRSMVTKEKSLKELRKL